MKPQLIQTFINALGKDAVLTAPEELMTYECEATLLFQSRPNIVLLPKTPEDVQKAVKLCLQNDLPYVARGAGTGLSGGSVPVEGGAIISLARLNKIMDVDTINQTATVEAGVVNAHLNQRLKPLGLFYAPDPSSQSACTIGGNMAENAGGIHCLKYGVTVDSVLALQVVTPDAELLWIGSKQGFSPLCQFPGLIVGSEGTLGIVTQAIVSLNPLPEQKIVYMACFASTRQATDCVTEIVSSGLTPAALELMDAFTAQSVNKVMNLGLPDNTAAILLAELDGAESQVGADQHELLRYLQHHNALRIDLAESDAERERLWKARKSAAASYGHYMPSFYVHDCVVPRMKVGDVLEKIEAIAKEYDVMIGNVFHAGDGNLHPNILFDPKDKALTERCLRAGDAIIEVCLEAGGVLTGEHGVGIEKQQFMTKQFSEETLEAMKYLKEALDHRGLANPRKILPQRSGCAETRNGLTPSLMASGEVWV